MGFAKYFAKNYWNAKMTIESLTKVNGPFLPTYNGLDATIEKAFSMVTT